MTKKKKVGRPGKKEIKDKVPMIEKDITETLAAIAIIVAAILLTLAAFGSAGVVGDWIYDLGKNLLGIGYPFLPLTLLFLSVSMFTTKRPGMGIHKILGSILFLVSGLSLVEIIGGEGGIVGEALAYPLTYLFEKTMGGIISFGVMTGSFVLLFETSIKKLVTEMRERAEKRAELAKVSDDVEKEVAKAQEEMYEEEEYEEEDEEPEPVKDTKKKGSEGSKGQVKDNGKEDGGLVFLTQFFSRNKAFTPPPLSLLRKDSGKPDVGDIKSNANMIKRTLQNFGINVEMDEISIGPSITRYALKPAEGVKLTRITTLQQDLSLALAAHPLRIEAPIPGKSLVGIEIPNSVKSTVGLGSLLASKEFQNPDKPLMMALGKGISGAASFADMAKMPHLLIAGATGSGKSVTAHALITSLLYRNSPDNLKFIMVDPKRVELTLYNGIPHLLTPVITDAKKTILALKWAAREMDRRYDILQEHKVQNIKSYHTNIYEKAIEKAKASGDEETPLPESMPYIVFVIDELADIMQAYPKELEAGIVRLAQMSRAVGIHLIISTQRPSVNVITGLIKANIPSRIALQVSSQIDSRTILDQSGAEKLLGAGDMLFLSGEVSQPTRIQSAFISEDEVKKTVEYLKGAYEDEVPEEIDFQGEQEANNVAFSSFDDMSDDDDGDSMYEEAKAAVVEADKASTSYIQRKLRVGYARAARLMDELEEKGVVGPADGSRPRDILIHSAPTEEEYNESKNDSSSVDDDGDDNDNNYGQ